MNTAKKRWIQLVAILLCFSMLTVGQNFTMTAQAADEDAANAQLGQGQVLKLLGNHRHTLLWFCCPHFTT